jgi:hypothetical protein
MKVLFQIAPESIGSGSGKLLMRWGGNGNFLAVAGSKRIVLVYNKAGKEVSSFSLGASTVPIAAASPASLPRTCSCCCLEWDPTGAHTHIQDAGLACIEC